MTKGALSGLKVLDLSRVLAGPWATQLLGDLGAEIIKIERPDSGDDTRHWAPPYQTSTDGENREASYFLSANRNKDSVCIDISTPTGQKLVRQLAEKSDVFIENFKVGGLRKFGLDYEALQKINPRLIYCSITGFGQTGPMATSPGYDLLIQAMGGLMSITGHSEGEPTKVGVALVDILTGMYAANAIQAAIIERQRSGIGQYIDVALLDCLVASLANQGQAYHATGKSPVRMGNAHPSIAPYSLFNTKDGHIVIAVGNDTQFQNLCRKINKPELAADVRFLKNIDRVQHRDALTTELNNALSLNTTQEWLQILADCGAPIGPVNSIEDIFKSPQLIQRGMKVDIPHENLGITPATANPVKLSRTPVEYRNAAPILGSSTEKVLKKELHYSQAEINEMLKSGDIQSFSKHGD